MGDPAEDDLKDAAIAITTDAATSSSDEEDADAKEQHLERDIQCRTEAPDGGWGWMIVLAVFLLYFIYGGLLANFGLVFVEIQRRYNSSAALTAWIGATQFTILLAFSPLATLLAQKFGTRLVVMLGGVLAALGVTLSAFVPRAEYLFFTFTLVAGFGGTLTYGPSLVIIGEYFNVKRGLAFGLTAAGWGLGTPIMAFVHRQLFSTYGYQGAMMILSAIYLNLCVCGALMRPLDGARNTQAEAPPAPKPRQLRTLQSEALQKLGSSYLSIHSSASHVPSEHSREAATERSTNHNRRSVCISVYFASLITSYALYNILASGVYILLAAHSITVGLTDDQAAIMVGILGTCSICGSLSTGLLDMKRVRPYKKQIYLGGLLWCTCVAIGCAFSTNMPQLIITVIMLETVSSANYSNFLLLVSDSVEPERLGHAIGLGMLLQGVAMTTGQAFAGWLSDYTGSYRVSFSFYAICGFAAALSYLFGILYKPIRDRLVKSTEQND